MQVLQIQLGEDIIKEGDISIRTAWVPHMLHVVDMLLFYRIFLLRICNEFFSFRRQEHFSSVVITSSSHARIVRIKMTK